MWRGVGGGFEGEGTMHAAASFPVTPRRHVDADVNDESADVENVTADDVAVVAVDDASGDYDDDDGAADWADADGGLVWCFVGGVAAAAAVAEVR